ncbi:MAG: Gfo/Idh/MocA family oxidoreductase [Eubacteriales bacterium]|nr:Gfo/Idh/MocA family oxidoreductase [Eubacteriales bacterium]
MSLKIGVIGTGAIGQEHIRRLNQKLVGSQVVAVTDINLEGAQKVADTYGNITVYKTYQEVVADPNVDALVITSWGPVHAEQVMAAIAVGKPVFVEKPMATTADDARKIVDAEIAFGKKLVQVGFMRRYDAGYKLLKEVIDSGKIGEPLVLHCAHRNPTVPTSYVTYMAINDTAIHELDCLHWLINDEWTSAQVIMPRATKNTHDKLKDPQILILTSAKGVRVVLEIFVNCQYGYDIQCEVVGETGIAKLPEPMSIEMRSQEKLSNTILNDWKVRFIESYDVELQDWIDSTVKGEVNGPTAWDGYLASVASDACVKAQESGAIEPIVTAARPTFYN